MKAVADAEAIIAHTRHWVEAVVVGHNFCPFARREVESERVRYTVEASSDMEEVLHRLLSECQRLDECNAGDDDYIETTLMVMSAGFEVFDSFLELLDVANALLVDQDYEGVYQLASFHPDYCFHGVAADDPGNYTNRSPYPTLHLIREASLEWALASVEQPELIPERNVELAHELGSAVLRAQLQDCYQAVTTTRRYDQKTS